jgi:hypothetical protein
MIHPGLNRIGVAFSNEPGKSQCAAHVTRPELHVQFMDGYSGLPQAAAILTPAGQGHNFVSYRPHLRDESKKRAFSTADMQPGDDVQNFHITRVLQISLFLRLPFP